MNARGEVLATTTFCATGINGLQYDSRIGRSICGARIRRRDLRNKY
jgi:hypothetical protein